jgi:Tn3 transposase DDE domain
LTRPSTLRPCLAARPELQRSQFDTEIRSGTPQFPLVFRFHIMLDWLESPDLRRQCHAGLNKSEQRHALAQVICTFHQERIGERSAEAQQFRASGLNLVIAAIVYWNSTYPADALVHLRASGELVPAELLPHTSPLSWEHIRLSGDFLWDRAAAVATGQRSLNLVSRRAAPDRTSSVFVRP